MFHPSSSEWKRVLFSNFSQFFSVLFCISTEKFKSWLTPGWIQVVYYHLIFHVTRPVSLHLRYSSEFQAMWILKHIFAKKSRRVRFGDEWGSPTQPNHEQVLWLLFWISGKSDQKLLKFQLGFCFFVCFSWQECNFFSISWISLSSVDAPRNVELFKHRTLEQKRTPQADESAGPQISCNVSTKVLPSDAKLTVSWGNSFYLMGLIVRRIHICFHWNISLNCHPLLGHPCSFIGDFVTWL